MWSVSVFVSGPTNGSAGLGLAWLSARLLKLGWIGVTESFLFVGGYVDMHIYVSIYICMYVCICVCV